MTEMKFKSNENLGAFRKSVYKHRKAPILEENETTGEPELTFRAKQVIEEIFGQYAV